MGVPKSYRSIEEFERETIRPDMKCGFSLDDLMQDTTFEGSDLLFDDTVDEYDRAGRRRRRLSDSHCARAVAQCPTPCSTPSLGDAPDQSSGPRRAHRERRARRPCRGASTAARRLDERLWTDGVSAGLGTFLSRLSPGCEPALAEPPSGAHDSPSDA